MPQPPLFLSYGMPKSGSTLAFELARTILELAGVPQPRIGDVGQHINFVNKLDGRGFEILMHKKGYAPGPIAIKTHSRLFPRIEQELRKGGAFGHAVCRDPRDIALSMLDAAREGRAWGGDAQRVPFKHPAEVKPRLHKMIRNFEEWVACSNIMPIYYERLAFDTLTVAGEIAGQLGIEVDLETVVKIATTDRFTQFNQGRPQRWKTEMDPDVARDFENEFRGFIETYCRDTPLKPVRHTPAKGWFAKWFKKR